MGVRGRATADDEELLRTLYEEHASALLGFARRLVDGDRQHAEDIDTACKLGFGHAMGPLATTDLTGVDILRHATANIYAETGDPKFFPPETLSRMVAAGDLGRKTGRGFYTY